MRVRMLAVVLLLMLVTLMLAACEAGRKPVYPIPSPEQVRPAPTPPAVP